MSQNEERIDAATFKDLCDQIEAPSRDFAEFKKRTKTQLGRETLTLEQWEAANTILAKYEGYLQRIDAASKEIAVLEAEVAGLGADHEELEDNDPLTTVETSRSPRVDNIVEALSDAKLEVKGLGTKHASLRATVEDAEDEEDCKQQ